MIRFVTIIALLVFSSLATAAPHRYQPPAKKAKCEKVLASDSLQERVHDLAIQVAEVAGQLKIKLDHAASNTQIKDFAEQIALMETAIQQIRQNFTVVATQDAAVESLKMMVDEYLPRITAGLSTVSEAQASGLSRQPRNFMKREIFGTGGPLAAMADWDTAEIEAYLREPQTPVTPVAQQNLPPPPPIFDFPYPYSGYQNWPPMEKP